jgi:hypothetical protein
MRKSETKKQWQIAPTAFPTIQKNNTLKIMKKIKMSSVLAAGVVAAVQMNQDQALANANQVTFTNETAINLSQGSDINTTMTISPAISTADELVSISGGSASGFEGVLTITADYSNLSTDPNINGSPSDWGGINLDTTSSKPFTEGTLDGLTFDVSATTGTRDLSIPAGTIFTFDVVTLPAPEPTSVALLAVGGAGVWLAARRRAGKRS